ncbi:MAG: fatty acid--CoA ligase family protein [Acidimicrobiia bacterium]
MTFTSLAELLEHDGAPDPLVWCEGAWSTRADVRTQARAVAGTLGEIGVRAGEIVVSLRSSLPAAVAAMFGVWGAGAALAPLNPRLTATELAAALALLRPRAVVADPTLDPAHRAAVRSAGCALVVDGAVRARLAPASADPTGPVALDPVQLDPGIALVLTTSGTTGPPKPVMLRHASVLGGLDAVLGTIGGGSRSSTPPRAPRPNLVTFALNFWSGIYSVCFALRVGAPIVLLPRFDARDLARLVREFDITSCVLAPAMLAALLDASDLTDLAPLKLVRNGTAPLSPVLARRFHERFGIPVLNGYGQTELGGEVVGWSAGDVRDFGDRKLGAVGRPHPNVEVRIVGDDGAAVPAGEVGEICVRTRSAMAGYLDGSGDTTRFTDDGLLRTGDLGRFDDDGFLWLEGRRTDVINRSGLKVFPGEVEEALRAHPDVADVAVAGVPDDRVGEVPWAFVVGRNPSPADGLARPPTEALAQELDAFARERLVAYKVPARFVFVDVLPRNDIGKVLRHELQAMATA